MKRTTTIRIGDEKTMYETLNDLPKAGRTELIGILNQRLADAVDLLTLLMPSIC
jgi:hypothetical protein